MAKRHPKPAGPPKPVAAPRPSGGGAAVAERRSNLEVVQMDPAIVAQVKEVLRRRGFPQYQN